MLEHRAAGKLQSDWIGDEVVIQITPTGQNQPRTYEGPLSDFEVFTESVTLYMDGLIIGVLPTTTVTRGTLNLPGSR